MKNNRAFLNALISREAGYILFFTALLMVPALILGPGGYDLPSISVRTRSFAAQLFQGELYPRWLADMYAGYGSPVFFYYPPLSYYLTAIFAFLSNSDAFGYAAIAASGVLSLLVGGAGCYLWLREELENKNHALLGALLFIVAPANIGYNFYYWVLFSSVWAYAWLPWLFWAARRLARDEAGATPFFALALCLLIITSIPVTVIFGPASVAYVAWVRFTDNKKLMDARWLARFALAIALGFGASAIFLLPALNYMDYAFINRHWSEKGSDYHTFFIVLGWNSTNQIIYTTVFTVFTSLTLFYAYWLRKNRLLWFFSAFSLFSLFMLLEQSVLIWEALPPLKLLQYPARFLMVPAICIAVLGGAAHSGRVRYLNCLLLAVAVSLTMKMANWDMRTSIDMLKQNPARYAMFTNNVEPYAHYMPAFAPFETLDNRFYTKEGLDEVQADSQQVKVTEGDAAVTVNTWQPRRIMLNYRAGERSLLELRRFYFPGLTAYINNVPLPVTANTENGKAVIAVDAGQGDITILLEPLMPELIGRLITLLSLATMVLLWLGGAYVRSRKPVH